MTDDVPRLTPDQHATEADRRATEADRLFFTGAATDIDPGVLTRHIAHLRQSSIYHALRALDRRPPEITISPLPPGRPNKGPGT